LETGEKFSEKNVHTFAGVREEYCCRGSEHNFTLLAVEGDGCFDRLVISFSLNL
jgi:hypothetical protein